jgi:hypothetical protein
MLVMSRGLYGQKYSGYFADSFTFFDTAAYIGTESTFTSINLGDEGSYYSYKWYGFIIPLATGTYTFQTVSDDASYVHIQGTEVVNNGSTHGEQTRSGTINLNAGTRYLIKIYFGENAGSASMNFSWSGGTQTSLTTDLTTDILQFYPQSDTLLPINYGLVGWYKGEAWNGTSWPDLSGNGNHCTVTRGTINKAGNYIYGGVNDGLRFPSTILPSTYTLFHVARYNGAYRSRIFDGVAANWLSGFWSGRTGVAYHDGWLTQYGTTAFPLDQILISTDQKSLYRGNGVNLTINSVTGSAKNLSINYGHFTDERSDWAVWEVIVYNRELTLDEIGIIEIYLFNAQYTIYTNPVVPRGVNYFNPRDIVFYKKTGYSVNINKMTANTTNILGLGSVAASGSSQHGSFGGYYQAFNGVIGDEGWHSLGDTYNPDGSYPGSNNISGYKGEWLKIQFTIPLFLNYSVMYARTGYNYRLPKTGYLMASNDNTNWSVIQYVNRSDQVSSFVLLDKYVQRPFKYYAIVVSSIFPDAGVAVSTNISEWYMDVKIPKFQISGTHLRDGSSPANAVYSAKQLVEYHPELDDGVYWINLPVVGPTQIYCILNTDCAGGGWMLAMKGTRGTTFNFDSTYWTTTNTLNAYQTNRNDGDAKFDTFNYFPSDDWLAIFPDVSVGGDVSGGYGGWTWVENNAVGKKSVREFYASPTQITKLSNGVDYPATNPSPTGSSKFNYSIWSTQNGFQWYGINYTTFDLKSVRWGFAWNNEANQSSNDVTGGIGLKYASYSAGDAFNCCQASTGVNRTMRFEWYVR